MGLKRRKGCSDSYLFRSKRCGKRVVRRYVGPLRDPGVQVLAKADGLTMAERRAIREVSRKDRDQYVEVERLIAQLEAVIKCLDRGWRLSFGKTRRYRNSRKRDRTMREYRNAKVQELPDFDHFNLVVCRADFGDDEALRELREMLDDYPHIWKKVGDLAAMVERRLIQLNARGNVIAEESARRKVASMRSELSGPDPSLLIRLVVERVVASWLDLQLVQLAASEPRSSKTDDTFWQKKLDRAQRRHLAAIEQLDKARLTAGSGKPCGSE